MKGREPVSEIEFDPVPLNERGPSDDLAMSDASEEPKVRIMDK